MEPVSTALAKIFRELLDNAPPAEVPIVAWPVVCGDIVASRTRAVSFSNGVLWVQVPDQDWKAQLLELEPQYVAALNTLKGDRVTRIEFLKPGDKPYPIR